MESKVLEAAKDLNMAFKSEKEKLLIKRIDELNDKLELMMKVIENMASRLDYLESRQ